jgi:ABC-type multidrug transport system ATPase subunit
MSKKTLEQRISNLIGVVPASTIAEICDDPEMAERIKKIRRTDIGSKVGQEAVGAFSTFALLNIIQNPEYFAASIAMDTGLEYTALSSQAEFRKEVMNPLINKLFQLLPHYHDLLVELQDRGHARSNYWETLGAIMNTEHEKFGLNKALVVSRPVTQAVSALGQIPAALLGLSAAATYATLPISARMGVKDKILEDRVNLIDESNHRQKIHGETGMEDNVERTQKTLWERRDENKVYQMLFGKIPDLSFLAAAAIAKTDSLGIFRYITQLFSTPIQYRQLKQSQLQTQRNLGVVESFHDIISGNPYFLTDKSWDEYRALKLQEIPARNETEPGIYVDNLQSLIPNKKEERYTPALSFSAKPGDIVFLHGQSGKGKSVSTGKGFAGLVKTKGAIYIKDEKEIADAVREVDEKETTFPLESLERSEVRDRISYVTPTFGFDEMRICDIYQRRVVDEYLGLTNKRKDELTDNEVLMLTTPDSLLERELYALADKMQASGVKRDFFGYGNPAGKVSLEGIKPTLPEDMFTEIYAFRNTRNKIVQDYLQTRGTNYESAKADQPVGHLSTGMKARFMWEMHREAYNVNGGNGKTRVIVIDEPFGALDEENTREYLGLIQELSEKEKPVVVLISHTREGIIRDVLGDKLKDVYFGEDPTS